MKIVTLKCYFTITNYPFTQTWLNVRVCDAGQTLDQSWVKSRVRWGGLFNIITMYVSYEEEIKLRQLIVYDYKPYLGIKGI